MNATLPAAMLNSLIWMFVLGAVGYWIFCLVNGTPRGWKLFLKHETKPEVRLKRWRSRVIGYFILGGVLLGYSITNTAFLLAQKPNANGMISLYDAGAAPMGMTLGGIIGGISGGIFSIFIRHVPGDVRPDEDDN